MVISTHFSQSKSTNFGHFPIFKLERQGYGCSFKHVKSGLSLISYSESEVRLPIQCGDVAKPEHFKLWKVERCWSSFSRGDTISSMLLINRDSNEGEAETNIMSTTFLIVDTYSFLRLGNETSFKNVKFWQCLISTWERQGADCSSKFHALRLFHIPKLQRLESWELRKGW